MEIKKKITIIEFMLFGSGPTAFAKNGTLSREKKYYKTFKYFNTNVKLIEYYIDRSIKNKLKKIIKILLKLILSIVHPFFLSQTSNNFEIIRTKQIYGSWSGIILKLLTRKKLIIRIGYSWSQSIFFESGEKSLKYFIANFLEKILLKSSDGLIFSSNYLEKKYRYLKKPYTIVPNCVDTQIFYKNNIEKEFDYIYVGRFIPIKGNDRLINFINQNVDKKFLIITSLKYFPIKNKNIRHIRKVANNRLPEFYRKSKHVLSLSRSEGSPKSLIEAIACGCIPCLSDIDSHFDILRDLGYGKIINYQKEINSDKFVGKFNSKDYKKFIYKYSMEYCVAKEIKFMKMIIS